MSGMGEAFQWKMVNCTMPAISMRRVFAQSGSGDLSLINCVVGEVGGSALYLLNATGNIEVARCRFENSEEGVLVEDVAQSISLVSCQYEGNSDYGVLNSNSGEVDARSSWWGDSTGPWHPETNPNGLGDRVSDGVLFETVEANGGIR